MILSVGSAFFHEGLVQDQIKDLMTLEDNITLLRHVMEEEKKELPLDEKRLYGVSDPPVVKYHCNTCKKNYLSQFISWDDDGNPLCPCNHHVTRV